MSNYYNLDGIKTELERQIEATAAKLEAWENVTFPTKKRRNAVQNNEQKYKRCNLFF